MNNMVGDFNDDENSIAWLQLQSLLQQLLFVQTMSGHRLAWPRKGMGQPSEHQ